LTATRPDGGGLRAQFLASLGFPLDPFQERALDALDAGQSVLVAAPTGAGKTVVAEYAVARALSLGTRAFYTTPLKALSNQKYQDLCRRHGSDQVGLLTGDNAIAGEAPVVVMTTEVLRNMIYAGDRGLDRLRYVVLDEVHYLQDPYRGAVWEEIIIHAPPHVVLVCLSATVSNAEEVADWISSVRGRTAAVIEERRPVELRHLYLVGDRQAERAHLLPTFVDGRPNPEAQALDERSQKLVRGRPRPRLYTPRRPEVVARLAEESMLPAIYFIFSRAGCDDAVRACVSAGIRLTSGAERQRIEEIAEAKVSGLSDDDLAVLGYGPWLEGLLSGMAAHHAGLVPPFKEAVEWCFAEALVKVVFATETLSLGINMPARSVVVEKLTKFGGERHEPLTPGEYTQLAGRAGRRGIDDVGYAVVLWSAWARFSQVAGLASNRTYALRSSFRPTYNMAANLVGRYSREEARRLLSLSFAQYLADASLVGLRAQLDRVRRRLAEAGGPARAERLSAEAGRLERRLGRHRDSLVRQLDAVLDLLEEWGYVQGWSLTDRGRRLSRLYHEADLLVAHSLELGLWDGLDPPEVAGLAAGFTYEARRPGEAPAPSERLLRRRWQQVGGLAARLAAAERDRKLPGTRPLDPGFIGRARAWARGQELDRVLSDEPGAGGDFVRNVKQLIDLLRQVEQVAPAGDTRAAAGEAAQRLFRGVVAASSVVEVPVEAGGASSGLIPPLVSPSQ
jgi:superfamily II RNA helicase